MRFARPALLVCGLLIATLQPGQAQNPAPPIQVPVPFSPTPTTPPPDPGPPTLTGTTNQAPQAGTSASPGTGDTGHVQPPTAVPPTLPLPPTSVETPLPGSSDTTAFAGDPNADPYKSVILDNADSFEQLTPGLWTGRGHVRVRYKGYILNGDRVDVDTNRGTATFSGNVHLVGPNGQTAQAGPDGTLTVNLRRGTYTLTSARALIQPEQTQIGLIQPVFVYGGVVSGRPGLIDARGGRFTTCDFVEPHYSFGARDVYIVPGKRLVGRDVTFFRKGRRLFRIPYIVVPLTDRQARQTLTPEVGQTPDEGYFIKFAIGYALAASLPGILRVDEFQKKGTGLGFDQVYGESDQPKRGSGSFKIYNLYDRSRGQDDLNGSLNHTQQFGTIVANLNTQFQQNSYLVGLSQNQSQNSTLNLTRDAGNLSTSLLTNLNRSSYGFGTSQTLNSSLDNTYRPTGTSELETKFDFSQFTSPGFGGLDGSNQQELDSNLDYRNRGKVVDLELLATKFTQLSSSSSGQGITGLERLPELRLTTDALRLAGLSRFLTKTTNLDLSFGDFNEPSSATHTERARLDVDLGTTTKTITPRSSFDYGGSFQQGFYGDNTAQYVLNGRTAYRLRIGSKSTLGGTYTYLRPYGYTPFQFDYAGTTNLASVNLTVQETRQFQATVGTGFNFNRTQSLYGERATPWQIVAAQALYSPSRLAQFRATAAYDLNYNRLVNLTNSLRLRSGDLLALDLSGRFDPTLHRYTTINGNLNLPFFRDVSEDAGYRLRAIGGYNGITSKFDYKGLALTRSWHDFEATLIYQDTPNGLRPGSTFTFNFRLKAFPAYEPFAVGQYGQPLDTGIGDTL